MDAPTTAAGISSREFCPHGREAQSRAFFSAPGIERLNSGVTIRMGRRPRLPPSAPWAQAGSRRRSPGCTAADSRSETQRTRDPRGQPDQRGRGELGRRQGGAGCSSSRPRTRTSVSATLTIGGVDYAISGDSGELDLHNLYEFSPCHGHYHFKYYGDLGWTGGGPAVNSKLGFASSRPRAWRTARRARCTTLAGCGFPGRRSGVGRPVQGGPSEPVARHDRDHLDRQADVPLEPRRAPLRGDVRGRGRGSTAAGRAARVEADGPDLGRRPSGGGTALSAEARLGREQHARDPGEDREARARADHERMYAWPDRPPRNCGFGTSPTTASCTPGASTQATFSIPANATPQVVRLTEFSHALNSPIPARYEDSWVPLQPGVSDQPAMLATVVVQPSSPVQVDLHLSVAADRGVASRAGGTPCTAPVFPDDPAATVTRS